MKKLNTKGFAHLAILLGVVVVFAIIGSYMLIQSRAATCKNYNWSSGKSSSCVKNIQRITNAAGARHWHYSGSAVIATDGIFGPKTKAQVKYFQRYTKISQDGIVGPNTWAQLCKYAGLLGSSNDGYKAAVSSGCVYSTPKSTTASTPKPTATQKPTTTSKPTATRTSTGNPQWRGDYQTGNFSQWPDREYREGGSAADLARQQRIVTSPARSGFKYTARFEVAAGDQTSGDTGRNRSEVADYADVSKLNGGTSWWAWSMYLPAGFHVDTDAQSPVGNGWMLTTQWHGVNDLNLVFGLTKGASPRLEISTMGKGTARSSDWVSPTALPLGRWNDFVVGVKWSNTAGHVTAKMNGTTLVNIDTPTLESGSNGRTYFKQGVYRARSNQVQALYYTGTRRGPTEASVTY